ncbi:MAG: hypothetical protein WDN30_01900 [Pararobbsia sp.]
MRKLGAFDAADPFGRNQQVLADAVAILEQGVALHGIDERAGVVRAALECLRHALFADDLPEGVGVRHMLRYAGAQHAEHYDAECGNGKVDPSFHSLHPWPDNCRPA